LLQKPTGGELPHITWCLTGPLTFLPVHAAGLYDTKEQPKIFDYVVSSYTPTLTALLSAKRRLPGNSPTARLLTISQPATPHQSRLPGTVREVDAIQTLQSQSDQLHITWLDDQKATVAAVLQHMKECNWIHLACHGVQDSVNPIDSAFLLIDNPLTLKEIMRQSFSHTELAVLSACQTAKGDSELPEEAIHLAAGMQMAGYGSVVATMWSIQDDDAPIIAEKFYKYLIEESGGDSGRAAYALHHAVSHLRNIKGENNFASWVPFIHLGFCSPLHTPPK
jgi:CHAT domain-containing protein